jgi:putative ABC transport system permease protein
MSATPASSAPRFALRRLRRGWRSGELLILTLALVVSVAAASAVGLFSDRVRRAVQLQSGDAIGADAIVSSRDPLADDTVASLHALGLRTARITEFASVVLAGDDTVLVSVKAAQEGYPLRGALRIASQPYADAREVAAVPPVDEAWVDLRVWQTLNLQPGAEIDLGESRFRVTGIIEYEPDRGAGFTDLAPRVLINAAALPQTGLIGVGSRTQNGLLLSGEEAALREAESLDLPAGARFQRPDQARPEVGRALESAGRFLDIAVLAAILLSAAAVALAARQYGQRQRDEVALLKCLGASSRFVGTVLVVQVLALGIVAGLVGALIGFAGQTILANLLAALLDTALPTASIQPLLTAWALELVLLLGFALPPVMRARRVSPVRVFQRDLGSDRSVLSAGLALLATVALLWWQAGDTRLALAVLGGAAVTALVLAALAWMLVGLLTPLRRTGRTALRFGLGNVARRRGSSVGQVVALGAALLSLLLLAVVQRDLLNAWQQRVPADAPNRFLINIQPDQVEPLQRFFAERGYSELRLWPMTRGRLVAFNGEPVTEESFDDPETRRWINREFNLSWTDRFDDDNELLEGQWWTAADTGKPWLSADDYVVERLNAKVGDKLTLAIADRQIELEIVNLRRVKWESFKPNFFLVTPPGVLDSSAGMAQYLTAVHIGSDQRELMRDLIRAFPNVTAFDLDALMGQVRGIVSRIAQAVQFLFAFALAAGACVLLAAIENTRAERVRETALLRTLGASRRTIAVGLITEYLTLGLLAGLVAAIAAQGIAWVLARQIFELPYAWSPQLWIGGAVGGALLVALLGWLSLRRVLDTPPRVVLAAA